MRVQNITDMIDNTSLLKTDDKIDFSWVVIIHEEPLNMMII